MEARENENEADEDEEREKLEMENVSFLEYLDELCGNEDFVRNVSLSVALIEHVNTESCCSLLLYSLTYFH